MLVANFRMPLRHTQSTCFVWVIAKIDQSILRIRLCDRRFGSFFFLFRRHVYTIDVHYTLSYMSKKKSTFEFISKLTSIRKFFFLLSYARCVLVLHQLERERVNFALEDILSLFECFMDFLYSFASARRKCEPKKLERSPFIWRQKSTRIKSKFIVTNDAIIIVATSCTRLDLKNKDVFIWICTLTSDFNHLYAIFNL